MTNRKGPEYETLVTNWFKGHGWPHAKRIVKEGAKDKGDVALGDGIPVTIECKNEKGLKLSEGQRELKVEMANNDHRWGFTIHKRPGIGNVGQHYAVLPVEVLMEILDTALPVRRNVEQPDVKPRVKRRTVPG